MSHASRLCTQAAAALRTGAAVMRSAAALLSRVASQHPSAPARDQRSDPAPEAERVHPGQMTMLIYELLDAHIDTAELAADLEHQPDWSAHIAYLCALQRYGREVLAQTGTGTGA
jgi:hypothetical protein